MLHTMLHLFCTFLLCHWVSSNGDSKRHSNQPFGHYILQQQQQTTMGNKRQRPKNAAAKGKQLAFCCVNIMVDCCVVVCVTSDNGITLLLLVCLFAQNVCCCVQNRPGLSVKTKGNANTQATTACHYINKRDSSKRHTNQSFGHYNQQFSTTMARKKRKPPRKPETKSKSLKSSWYVQHVCCCIVIDCVSNTKTTPILFCNCIQHPLDTGRSGSSLPLKPKTMPTRKHFMRTGSALTSTSGNVVSPNKNQENKTRSAQANRVAQPHQEFNTIYNWIKRQRENKTSNDLVNSLFMQQYWQKNGNELKKRRRSYVKPEVNVNTCTDDWWKINSPYNL